jgi:hypothetical protein
MVLQVSFAAVEQPVGVYCIAPFLGMEHASDGSGWT